MEIVWCIIVQVSCDRSAANPEINLHMNVSGTIENCLERENQYLRYQLS